MSMDYDTLAADYAQHRRTHPEVLRRLVEDGRLTASSKILDVGCGTGNYTVALSETLGCDCWAVEPSTEMRRTAQARAASAHILEGSAEGLDFPEGTFDFVFSVDVIHHVADRPAYHRGAARVLKPGGRLCTVTDSEEIIRNRVPLATHFPETVAVELARYPRTADLRAMMEEAGLSEIREETVAFSHPLTDIQRYRDKAFSSLHLIAPEAFTRGIRRLEQELAEHGSVPWTARYLLLWGTKA